MDRYASDRTRLAGVVAELCHFVEPRYYPLMRVVEGIKADTFRSVFIQAFMSAEQSYASSNMHKWFCSIFCLTPLVGDIPV
ncbi:hypothetical protein CPC08DRAFT_707427 [Agrocybe pediades]|nr:hypothetical protein CPC08DRAFT_707427 [Agrocybe pediades]